MKTSGKYIFAAVAALMPLVGHSQSRDHVVVVSNAYEATVGAVTKDLPEMALPDSLHRFDLDFDYSVMENPFKGSYVFSPKRYDVTPARMSSQASNFYLSAGAGYTLHPELMFAWTGRSDDWAFHLRGDHTSYFGDWHDIAADPDGTTLVLRKTGESWKGFNMTNRLSGDFVRSLAESNLAGKLSYEGMGYKDFYPITDWFHSVAAEARYAAKSMDVPFFYDVAAKYRFSTNRSDYDGAVLPTRNESYIVLDATLASNELLEGLLLDIDSEMAFQGSDGFNGMGGLVALTPKYQFEAGDWAFSLGVRFEGQFGKNSYDNRWRVPYPAIKVKYAVIPSMLDLYVKAEGKGNLNPYIDQVRANRFCNSSATLDFALFDFSFVPVDAALGARGSLNGRLQYDFSVGYEMVRGGLLPGVNFTARQMYPMISMIDYNRVYALLRASWRSDRLTVDGSLLYNWTDAATDGVTAFAPAAFTGDVNTDYRFTDKFSAGVSLAFSTGRHTGAWKGADEVLLPGWVNPGVHCRYVLSPTFSIWAKGSNLAGMTIQKSPLYAEKGVSATAGISLVF